jgi:hypothetical protein
MMALKLTSLALLVFPHRRRLLNKHVVLDICIWYMIPRSIREVVKKHGTTWNSFTKLRVGYQASIQERYILSGS